MQHASYDGNGSPLEQDGNITLYQTATQPIDYGEVRVLVTDELLAALDDALEGDGECMKPASVTELMALRLQMALVRHSVKRGVRK